MTTKPKRHHFLPEFYLSGFTRDNYLWVYDRKKDEYRRQHPHNTAVIGQYYTVENPSGERDYSVEGFLSQIEGKAKCAIVKLDRGLAIGLEERLDLAFFITLLLTRTPKFEREMQQTADRAAKLLAKHKFPTVEAVAEHLRRSGKSYGFTPESFHKFVHEEQFFVKGHRNIVVEAMLELAKKAQLTLALMDWSVVHAPEPWAFITTDSPLGYIVPAELSQSGEPVLGLLSEQVTKLVPLTQRTALRIEGFGWGLAHYDLNMERVLEFSISVATECDSYVIGRDEALVRSVVRSSTVDTCSPGTQMKVEHLPHPTDPTRTFLVSRLVPADAADKPLRIVVEK
jgi:hypothetical protein